MKPLDETFEIHKQSMLDAIEVCRSIPEEINKFTLIVSALPATIVKLRLTVIQGLIISGERALRLQHGDKGFVFVMAGQCLLSVRWSELDYLAGQKESLGSSGSLFIAPEVVVHRVEELVSQVDSGELVPAVDWLSRYEMVFVEGINPSPWTGSHEKQDAIENGPDIQEEESDFL